MPWFVAFSGYCVVRNRPRPPMKGQYFPNTKSQATDEGSVFSEHQEPGHRWRASIFRKPRARSPMKSQYSPNTKSQITDERPISSEHQKPDHRWRASIIRTPRLNFPARLEVRVNFMSEACEIVNPARKLANLLYVEMPVFSDAFHLSLN